MKLGKWSGAILLGALSVAVGCGAQQADDNSADDQSQIRELERRAVGAAQPYPAEQYSQDDADKFASSKQARRQLGWHVLAKALQPVKIAAQDTSTATSAATQPKPERTVPLFRTWLGGDEIDRLFAKMYGDLGKDRRVSKDIPTTQEIAALYDWNSKALGPSSEADFFARLQQLGDQTTIDGLGGNARVAYSPGYVNQYLTDFTAMAGCDGKLEGLTIDTPPIDADKNFTNCFSHEMETDAAVVKMSWRRNDALVTGGLPVVDTSAAGLTDRLSGTTPDKGGWNLTKLPSKPAGPDDAYSVTLSDSTGYSLAAMHIMTKELRHWIWVTVWWSPDANSDFGQDRPAEITQLGAPWSNYKMCVVTDFEEKDPDPRGGFDGSLGDALAAVHGPATWCSDSFIEKGDHNAQTNCIGCHQHAGDVNELDALLNDETKYPLTGRKQIRKGFPSDYSWAFATPASPDQKDRLLDVVLNRMKVYARTDSN